MNLLVFERRVATLFLPFNSTTVEKIRQSNIILKHSSVTRHQITCQFIIVHPPCNWYTQTSSSSTNRKIPENKSTLTCFGYCP